MNAFDLVLLVAVGTVVVGGWRVGLVARVSTWLGLAGGVLLATWTVPVALRVLSVGDALVGLFAGLVVLALTVSVVTSMFQIVGTHIRHLVARTPLSGIDRGAGAVAGAAALLAVVWFLIPAAAEVPGSVSRQVRNSAAVAVIRDVAPEPPDASRAVRTLIHSSRFPEVFTDLDPAPLSGPPPDAVPVSRNVVERTTASTVNVEAGGCGRRYEGSGFTVATDTIVTNAHVVAGSETIVVKRPDGTERDGEVIVFDPDRDIAVVRVPDLGQEPLDIAQANPGGEGVTIGYPGGQDQPRVAPVRVEEQRTAVGRDIYGRDRTERQVLFLSARLQQGDSGSPLVDAEGNVGGIVFAISPDQPTTAYALAVEELTSAIESPAEPGETGACI